MVETFQSIVKKLNPTADLFGQRAIREAQGSNQAPIRSASFSGGRNYTPAAPQKSSFLRRFGQQLFPRDRGQQEFSNVMMAVTPIGAGVKFGTTLGGAIGKAGQTAKNLILKFDKKSFGEKIAAGGTFFGGHLLGEYSATGQIPTVSLRSIAGYTGAALSLPGATIGAGVGIGKNIISAIKEAKGSLPAQIPGGIPNFNLPTPTSTFNISGSPAPIVNVTSPAQAPPVVLGGGGISIGSGGGGGEAALLLALLAGGIGGGYLLGRRRRRRKKAKYKKRKRA